MNTKYLRHIVTTCGLALLLMLCGTSVETAHAQDGAHGDVVNGDTLDLGGPSKADVSALEGNVMLNSTSPLSATLQGNISTRVNLFEQPSCLWSYATVAVSENGQAVGGLDKDDFDVQEDDGVCDYFVSQAGTQGGTAQADFVFAVDNSGSMGGDQDDINDALDDFATALDNSGIDFRIGLTRYGQSGFGAVVVLDQAHRFGKIIVMPRSIATPFSTGTTYGLGTLRLGATSQGTRPSWKR